MTGMLLGGGVPKPPVYCTGATKGGKGPNRQLSGVNFPRGDDGPSICTGEKKLLEGGKRNGFRFGNRQKPRGGFSSLPPHKPTAKALGGGP